MKILNSLNENQIDMLAEIFNMGMGRSVGALSKITSSDHEITFDLPKVTVITPEEFADILNNETTGVIVQEYSGIIHGKALFYFPKKAGGELAKVLIGTDIPVDQVEKIESDALIEIGNIFINSSLSCLANFIGIEIFTDVPKLLYKDKVLEVDIDRCDIIHLSAGFSIKHLNIDGHVVLVLNDISKNKLVKIIDELSGM